MYFIALLYEDMNNKIKISEVNKIAVVCEINLNEPWLIKLIS